MRILEQSDIDQLNTLSSNTLEVKADENKITARLLVVVALSNFKALAAMGRLGEGASFDAASKTLSIQTIKKSDLAPAKMKYLDGSVDEGFRVGGLFYPMPQEQLDLALSLYPFNNYDKLIGLAQRLGGKKAKTFATIKDAFAAKKAAAPKATQNESVGPEEMDMPMWDPVRREWFDQEIETRPNAEMREHIARPDMGSYGHDD